MRWYGQSLRLLTVCSVLLARSAELLKLRGPVCVGWAFDRRIHFVSRAVLAVCFEKEMFVRSCDQV